ncbi:MAG: ATP-binding cassette subfamily B protein RaxB [Candidatus Azotimanducaceae bacterium]|jgi:ATP-binding cassette subfamily B protein RaxB
MFQGEANECGLAALGSILNHYGHHLTLQALRKLHPSGAALSLDQLNSLAQSFHFQSRCLSCEPADLTQLALPAILHVDFDHYVVLTKVSSRELSIMDPGRGQLAWTWKTLGQRFTGIVLELTPGPEFEQQGTQTHYHALALLSKLPLNHLFSSLGCLVGLSVVVQAFALVTPFFLQVVVDEVLLLNNIDMAFIVAAGFGSIYLLSAMTQWMRGLLTIRLGTQLSYMLSAGLLRHATALPLKFFRRRSVGDIVSRFGSLRPIQEFIAEGAVVILLDLLMIASTLTMILCFSTTIALLVSAMTVCFMISQWLLLKPYRRHNHEFLMSDAEVQTHFIETLQSIHTIKRFESTRARGNEWQNRLTLSLNAQVRAGQWALGSDIIRYLFSGFLILGVAYLSIGDIVASTLTIGMLYTLIAYANHFASAVLSITQQWQAYMMLSLHAERVSDLSDHPADTRVEISLQEKMTLLEIDGVSIAFPGSGGPLTEDLSLTVRAQESVAITGISGSGKSSLLAVLTGEQWPRSGEVRMNGQPHSRKTKACGMFTMLMPDDTLIQGSVIDNIVYGDTQIDQPRLLEAAQIAEIHGDIIRLPLSYQEKLSEHSTHLSSGQRQRLLIARALYRRADIMILDEGTSHLDAATEMRIMRRILALPVMCFYVTHRLEIALLADHHIDLDALIFDEAPDVAPR